MFNTIKATDVVEAQRRFATAAIGTIPHAETKDAFAKVAGFNFSLATAIAEKIDEATENFVKILNPTK